MVSFRSIIVGLSALCLAFTTSQASFPLTVGNFTFDQAVSQGQQLAGISITFVNHTSPQGSFVINSVSEVSNSTKNIVQNFENITATVDTNTDNTLTASLTNENSTFGSFQFTLNAIEGNNGSVAGAYTITIASYSPESPDNFLFFNFSVSTNDANYNIESNSTDSLLLNGANFSSFFKFVNFNDSGINVTFTKTKLANDTFGFVVANSTILNGSSFSEVFILSTPVPTTSGGAVILPAFASILLGVLALVAYIL